VDLAPTPEQEAFRHECRQWLQENLPWEYGQGLPPLFDDLAEEVAFLRKWQAALAEARLVGVSWPVEFGGRGAGPLDHYIVQEELARARAPELVGRLPVTVSLEDLDEEALVRILQEPRNALVKQYQKMFELEGIGLTFDPGALREMARQTFTRGTGARGLRAVMERVMNQLSEERRRRNRTRNRGMATR